MDEKIKRSLAFLYDDMSISFMRLQVVLDSHGTNHVRAEDELLDIATDLRRLSHELATLATSIKAAE